MKQHRLIKPHTEEDDNQVNWWPTIGVGGATVTSYLLQLTGLYSMEDLSLWTHHYEGWWRIFTWGLVHKNLAHLAANILPLCLGMLILTVMHPKRWALILAILYLGTGIITFYVGRPGFHGGASGLVFALIFYLITAGFVSRDREKLSISVLMLFLFGSTIIGIFPSEDKSISYEGHASGAVMGVITAIFFTSRRKKPEDHHDEESVSAPYEMGIKDYISAPAEERGQ